jgi:hypothetical protein
MTEAEEVIVARLTALARLGRAGIVLLATGALALQGGIAWGATWVVENERRLKDQLVAYQFEPSAEILSYGEQAGLSSEGTLYFHTSLPQVVPVYEFDRYCTRREAGIGVLGCYTTRDGRIYLYDVTDSRLVAIEPVVAAHEMLHAAWARIGASERERLGVLLEEGFALLPEDHEMRSRIQSYEDNNPASRIPELYAILGTETRELPAELEAHYAIYFDDRSKVVALAEEVYRVFDTVQEELLALATELESRAAEIEGLRFTYENTNSTLSADIAAFEVKRTTPGGFPSRTEFEEVRSELVERQAKLRDLRDLLNVRIDEYNVLLDDLTRLNAEVSELNQGINIRLREEDELEPQTDSVEGSTFGFRGIGGCCGNELPSHYDGVTDHGFAARPAEDYRRGPGNHECNYWTRPLQSI